MPYGSRVLLLTEGDKSFAEFIYNDASGSLKAGMPVYIDVTDAAEFNAINSNTALSPAAKQTGGKVVLGTNANVGAAPYCVGVFQPDNFNELPVNGAAIKVLLFGRGIVRAQSPAAGAAGNVGSNLVISTAVVDAVPGAKAAGTNIGVLLATGTHVAAASTIFAAASATETICNAFINPC